MAIYPEHGKVENEMTGRPREQELPWFYHWLSVQLVFVFSGHRLFFHQHTLSVTPGPYGMPIFM